MNRRHSLTFLTCTPGLLWSATAAIAQPAKQPIHVYAFQEGDDPSQHTKHTLFLVGDGDAGVARYTAASFQNGTRYSLASSGSGTWSAEGEVFKIKAGKLEGSGVIKRGEFVQVAGLRFAFAMKM
jgi:hypothetical protein